MLEPGVGEQVLDTFAPIHKPLCSNHALGINYVYEWTYADSITGEDILARREDLNWRQLLPLEESRLAQIAFEQQ